MLITARRVQRAHMAGVVSGARRGGGRCSRCVGDARLESRPRERRSSLGVLGQLGRRASCRNHRRERGEMRERTEWADGILFAVHGEVIILCWREEKKEKRKPAAECKKWLMTTEDYVTRTVVQFFIHSLIPHYGVIKRRLVSPLLPSKNRQIRARQASGARSFSFLPFLFSDSSLPLEKCFHDKAGP